MLNTRYSTISGAEYVCEFTHLSDDQDTAFFRPRVAESHHRYLTKLHEQRYLDEEPILGLSLDFGSFVSGAKYFRHNVYNHDTSPKLAIRIGMDVNSFCVREAPLFLVDFDESTQSITLPWKEMFQYVLKEQQTFNTRLAAHNITTSILRPEYPDFWVGDRAVICDPCSGNAASFSMRVLLGNDYIDIQTSMYHQKHPSYPLAPLSLPENWQCIGSHVLGLNWYIYWLRLIGFIKQHDMYRVTDVCGHDWYVGKGSAGEGDLSPVQLANEAERHLEGL